MIIFKTFELTCLVGSLGVRMLMVNLLVGIRTGLSLFLTEAKESHLSSGEKRVLVKSVTLLKPRNTLAERNGNKYTCKTRMKKLGTYCNIHACGKQLG